MTSNKKLPRPGAGVVGFGCMFVLVILIAMPGFVGESWQTWLAISAVGVVLGLLAARFGEPVFEKVLSWFYWWWRPLVGGA